MRTIAALVASGIISLALVANRPAHAQASFLDVTSFTPGQFGQFIGTLAGIDVTGELSTTTSSLRLAPIAPDGQTIIDNLSPRFSHSAVFAPTVPLTDAIGYDADHVGGVGPGTMSLHFSQPVTNPTFHVSNLDSLLFDFSPTPGLSLITITRGNGGPDSDGLALAGLTIFDQGINTSDNTAPSLSPPTAGGRSAYGSIKLHGTFTTIAFDMVDIWHAGDSGTFTVSLDALGASAPEPGTLALLVLGLVGGGIVGRRVRR